MFFFTYFCLFFRYLQEVGYTDNILDVRQARVRQILGVDFDASHQGSGKEGRGGSPNGSDSSGSSGGGGGKRLPSGRANRIAEALSDTEASVLATFDFLGGNGMHVLNFFLENQYILSVIVEQPT